MASLQGTSATGRISIRLVSYKNEGSRVASGDCCDGMNLICSMQKCDPYFRLCIVKAGSPRSRTCPPWRETKSFDGRSEISFPKDLGKGLTNPLYDPFPKWEVRKIIQNTIYIHYKIA